MTFNIMVTASGSAVGQGIIKSLKQSSLNLRIITTDADIYSAGLYRGNVSYIISLAKDPSFVDEVIDIANKEKIDVIFIGTDYELSKFSKNKEKIENKTNAIVIVSSPELIEISDDKWRTYEFMKKNGFDTIPSTLIKDAETFAEEEGFPLIIKPRIGDSSKDIYISKNKEEFEKILTKIKSKNSDNPYLTEASGFMVQKLIGDDENEFTSTTINHNGSCFGVISLNREMKFGGHTTKATVVESDILNSKIKKIAEKLKPFGPCNFQSKFINNIPYIFEINCRFSGTTPFCSMLGFNPVEAIIRKVLLNEKDIIFDTKKGVILRYFNEVFIPEEEINNIKKENTLQNSKSEINKWF